MTALRRPARPARLPRPLERARALLADLRCRGVIGEDAASWLTALLSRLQPAAQDRGRYRRFVHGDAQPSNVLVVDGRYSAIIDWDDAGWSDPVVDLRYVPLRVGDKVLEGYRAVMPIDGDDSAEQRLVWDKLTGASGSGGWHGPLTALSRALPQGRSSMLAAATDEGAPLCNYSAVDAVRLPR